MTIVSSGALFDVLRQYNLLSKPQLHEVMSLARGRCADVRMLAKTPGVVVLIILTLSLGIGGSTLLFNMVRQWILHPVSFPQAADRAPGQPTAPV